MKGKGWNIVVAAVWMLAAAAFLSVSAALLMAPMFETYLLLVVAPLMLAGAGFFMLGILRVVRALEQEDGCAGIEA